MAATHTTTHTTVGTDRARLVRARPVRSQLIRATGATGVAVVLALGTALATTAGTAAAQPGPQPADQLVDLNPTGALLTVESTVPGTVHVAGWVADASDRQSAIPVNVYIGGLATDTGAELHELRAVEPWSDPLSKNEEKYAGARAYAGEASFACGQPVELRRLQG